MNQNWQSIETVPIPGGSFLMGSEDFDDTRPIHRVTLSPFEMGKYPITQAQYRAVMGDNPSNFKGDTLPVEQVSWDDAVSFCKKLSKQTGRIYRLPTEAEWEYACLAGSTGKYCFGDDKALLEKYACYYKNSGSKTHPVGEKLPNAWGLHEMHGNVWEWCSDWYDKNYYAEFSKQGDAINPQGPAKGEYRVLRGGSWLDVQMFARAVYRSYFHPALRLINIGFRVVLCRPPSSRDTEGALAPETADTIPAETLNAATRAIARRHGWTQTTGEEHPSITNYNKEWLAHWRPDAQAALEAAGVDDLLARRDADSALMLREAEARIAELETALTLGYELSTWMAGINWGGGKNQKEWLDDLRAKIEEFQSLAIKLREQQ